MESFYKKIINHQLIKCEDILQRNTINMASLTTYQPTTISHMFILLYICGRWVLYNRLELTICNCTSNAALNV